MTHNDVIAIEQQAERQRKMEAAIAKILDTTQQLLVKFEELEREQKVNKGNKTKADQ